MTEAMRKKLTLQAVKRKSGADWSDNGVSLGKQQVVRRGVGSEKMLPAQCHNQEEMVSYAEAKSFGMERRSFTEKKGTYKPCGRSNDFFVGCLAFEIIVKQKVGKVFGVSEVIAPETWFSWDWTHVVLPPNAFPKKDLPTKYPEWPRTMFDVHSGSGISDDWFELDVWKFPSPTIHTGPIEVRKSMSAVKEGKVTWRTAGFTIDKKEPRKDAASRYVYTLQHWDILPSSSDEDETNSVRGVTARVVAFDEVEPEASTANSLAGNVEHHPEKPDVSQDEETESERSEDDNAGEGSDNELTDDSTTSRSEDRRPGSSGNLSSRSDRDDRKQPSCSDCKGELAKLRQEMAQIQTDLPTLVGNAIRAGFLEMTRNGCLKRVEEATTAIYNKLHPSDRELVDVEVIHGLKLPLPAIADVVDANKRFQEDDELVLDVVTHLKKKKTNTRKNRIAVAFDLLLEGIICVNLVWANSGGFRRRNEMQAGFGLQRVINSLYPNPTEEETAKWTNKSEPWWAHYFRAWRERTMKAADIKAENYRVDALPAHLHPKVYFPAEEPPPPPPKPVPNARKIVPRNRDD